MKKLIIISVFCICFFDIKAQDTIWLKSGKTIAGQIISFADSLVSIKTGQDAIVYRLNEIKSLRYNGPANKSNSAAPVKVSKVSNNKRQDDEMEAKTIKRN